MTSLTGCLTVHDGRPNEYHGVAIHPQHLSVWERWMGVGKNYHPELDTKQKIQDIRSEWEEREAARAGSDSESGNYEEDDSEFTAQVDSYFRGKPAPINTMSEKIGIGSGGSSGTSKNTDQSPSNESHSIPGSSRGESGNVGAADENLSEKQRE